MRNRCSTAGYLSWKLNEVSLSGAGIPAWCHVAAKIDSGWNGFHLTTHFSCCLVLPSVGLSVERDEAFRPRETSGGETTAACEEETSTATLGAVVPCNIWMTLSFSIQLFPWQGAGGEEKQLTLFFVYLCCVYIMSQNLQSRNAIVYALHSLRSYQWHLSSDQSSGWMQPLIFNP